MIKAAIKITSTYPCTEGTDKPPPPGGVVREVEAWSLPPQQGAHGSHPTAWPEPCDFRQIAFCPCTCVPTSSMIQNILCRRD